MARNEAAAYADATTAKCFEVPDPVTEEAVRGRVPHAMLRVRAHWLGCCAAEQQAAVCGITTTNADVHLSGER